MDASNIAKIYFKGTVRLHDIPNLITSNRYAKFTSHFCRSLWKLMGTELCFSRFYHPQTGVVYGYNPNDMYPAGEYNKLNNRKIGPCEIFKKINVNAYSIKLPSHMKTPYVFNVKHLIPYT
ncbi:hypothetical protein AMTRI_Chr01g126610 [Amborella trichopoda]